MQSRHLGGWDRVNVTSEVGHQKAGSQNCSDTMLHTSLGDVYNPKDIITSVGKAMGKLESSHAASGSVRWCRFFAK